MKPRIQAYFDQLVVDIAYASIVGCQWDVCRYDHTWLWYLRRRGLIEFVYDWSMATKITLNDGAWQHASQWAQDQRERVERKNTMYLLGDKSWG
jgi:hypothetical protein